MSRAGSAACYAAGAFLAAFAVLLTLPEQAEAQTVTTFISNSAQASGNTAADNPRATAFTTGDNTAGYGLTSVDIFTSSQSGSPNPLVQIVRNSAGDRPGTLHATLINPATVTSDATNTFNAPPNTTLTAETVYWLVVSNDDAENGAGFRIKTGSETADTGAAMGWSIGAALWKLDIRNVSWSNSSSRIIFAVKGTAAGTTPVTNTAAMGAPTITGTAQVGQTLTAVTTGITDADGLTSPTYTYQWIRVDGVTEADIAGENSSTYTLDDADLGKTIKVKVSFEDDASNTETLTSAVTVTVTAAASTNTAPTAADKTVTTGEDRAYTFEADDFGFDDDDAGATLASVTIVTLPMVGTLALDGTAVMADDVVTTAQIDGDMLTFTPARDAHGDPYTTFTFTVNDGTDDSASAYTMTIDVTDAPAPVCAVPDIAGDGRRQIWTGTVTVGTYTFLGSTFYGYSSSASAGELDDRTFTIGSNDYTVDRARVEFGGSRSGTLAFELLAGPGLTTVEVEALRLHVCDTVVYNFSGATTLNASSWSTTLDWSPPVETRTVYLSLPANNDATGEPAITGTAQAGQELTADASPIMDTDGLPSSFTYQWVRVDADGMSNPADITDETDATYTLTAADAGKRIKVKVSFTDELSGEEERTSAAYPSSGTVTTASTTNNAPTAANKTVTTGEDRPYTFMEDDFGFMDADAGATLASVTIVTLPMVGTLALDGTAVMADDVVTKAQIDGDMLTFTPARDAHGDPYTTFTFTVNDGTDDSASAYTMTIDVTDAPLPVCGVPDIAGAGRRQIWTGTVTVERVESEGFVLGYGFNSGTGAGSLADNTFSVGANDYTVSGIGVATSGELQLGLTSSLTTTEVAALKLHVCDTSYDFADATHTSSRHSYTWAEDLDWSPPVDTRTLYLSLPANNVATGEPAITGTAQAGQDLTADASPIMDTDGLTGVSFTYQWVRVDADGMSNPADITDATAATYSLTAADAGKKVKVKVSFTDELSGEEERTSAAYPSSGTVTASANTTAPALLSVTVTSTPHKTTDTYGAREHIEFSMTFDAPVTVTGDPTFAFDLGGASTATWYAGSGTATLRFSHAVTGGTSGDRDTNGISWAENAIALNGGTIAGTDNAVAAVLTHAAQSNLAAHKVDGRTTAVTAATVTVAVTSTPTSLADTYGFGETIVITVTASEAVEVEGDPEFEFSLTDMGGAANDVPATYDRTRSSPTTIVFTYTVQAGDRDNNGIWIGDHSRTFMLDANDRIRTASQQIDIDRSHPEKSTHDGHKVDGSLGAPTVPPDPTAPTLVSATATTLTIEWTHPGDGGSPLTRNFIEYRVEGTTDWTNWYRGETPTPVTRAVITNLQAETAYDVRVHATNAIGNSSWTQSATAFSTLAGNPATGAPTITGTAAVGQPLAVDLTGIEDADGLTNVSYSYQWVRVDADGMSNPADITDATDATYTLVDADLGKTLKVRVTFDDDGGNTETRTSAATATVTTAAGTPASPTNLSATVGVGQVVLVWQHSQGVGGTRSSYEYRSSAGAMIAPDAMWQQVRTGPGALNTAYYQVVKGLTSGTIHTFQVRAVNPQGGSAPATVTATPISQPSCTIDELGDRRLLWQGQLTAGIIDIFSDGKLGVGNGSGIETGTLTPSAFTFRSTTYSSVMWTYDARLNVSLLDQDMNGWRPREEVVDVLRVHVCNTPYDFSDATVADVFSEFGDYHWNVGLSWPPGIERTLRLSLPPNHAATGDPVISGTVQVGEELTAVTTGIMDEDVLDDVFTYQWMRVDADGTSNEEDITDATAATYTLTADERGKKVKVEVRFVDILGGEETRTSAPTETLAGTPNTPATGAPTITGTAQVGETLTASTTGIADANGLTSPTYTYQWIRVDGTDEADIASANSSTYILVDADLGTTLKVRVTFADDLGHTETLTSAATATVGAVATAPTVNDVAVTSTPASGTTYYLAGEVIEFTVTFSAPVTVTATPKFAFRLGAATRQAAYASGSGSAALVFARTVQAGEVDRNGISWNALALALDGGTITQTGATTAASLTHAEQAPLEGHRVDAAPPMQVSASVHGMSLVLVYDEPLDPASMPATGAYTVTATVGATTTNPAVSEVSIYGIWVTLTLDAAPAAGATVTLAYAPPASNPVQDEAGNDAPAFSGQSVRLGPPPPVTDLAQVLGVGVVPGNAQLVVTWTAVSTATGYTVQWMSSGQGYNIGDRQATVTTGSTTRYTIPSLTNGTEYTVRVIATRTGATDGPPSDEMTGTPRVPPPPPPPVTDLEQVLGVGVIPGNAQLVVTWTAVSTATGYTVQWMSSGQGYNIGDRQATVTPGSTTRYTIPSLTNGTEYTVRVIATRTGADDGPPSAEVKGTPFTTPGAPQHLSGVPGDEQVMLTWDAPSSDGGSAILRYEYAIDDSGTWIDAGLDLEETVPGLTNGQQYAFEVRAVNSAGPGAPARTAATPLGMPSVPESLTATGGDGEVVLEWTEPADDGGSPVTGYGYRYVAGQAVPEDVTWRDAGTELTATVSGLENETRYTFEVRARNRVGPGETSGTTALPLRLRAELFSTAVLATEVEALVVGVRRSGGLAFPAHAYIGVTDSALPGVTATDEGRDDGLGRHRLEFAAGAAEATVTVTVAFDGERRQDRVLSATLDSAELEVDGVRRPYELVTPTLVVPVTEGDAGLSVADARVQGKSSVLAFTVSLDHTRDVAVRVDYATEDGSARAGEDYTAVSGTLTIEAGGRERTVEVPVLPALHVTGERTLVLRLSNAVSAVIDDGVATGVIVRESELPKAWLARFGRTASDHAAQAIARRLEAGQRETQVTVAGRRVDGLSVDGLLLGVLPSGGWRPASAVEDMATRLAAPALAASGAPFGGVDADPGTPGLRAGTWGGAPGALDREPFADAGQTLRRAVLPDFGYRLPGAEEALLGTSFYVERGAQQDVGGGTWAAWGDVAATRFEGDAGGLALNGDVVTGTAGLDRQWRAVLVGLALSRSSGEGGYGTSAGTIASTLTSVHPYVQVRLGERAQVWGAAGWGRGGLEITPESGAALEADLRNSMAAAGARAVLMGAGGLEIALRSDFLWTETSSDGTAALAEVVGTASRGRLMLEGAGQIQGLGGVVRPKVEGGVRYDGGDAETGRGFEVGGGLDWARGSLTLQVNGRMLVAHADESYEEWGYSGSLVYEPGADGLGLQMRVGSSAGAAASGIRNLWALENASGLVRGGGMPFAQRFDAEVGYGIGRGTLWYPYVVADDSGQTRYGLKLSSGRRMGVGLEFGRRESVDLGPQDAMLLRGELRF